MLSRDTTKGPRDYEFTVHGKLIKELENVDKQKYFWIGRYEFNPPSTLVKSTLGDEPVYFTDTAISRSLTFAASKPDKK